MRWFDYIDILDDIKILIDCETPDLEIESFYTETNLADTYK